ncbi:MAG: hypothetical protein IJO62_05175 [Clostridia bacterium]|nr:hypothetical protein [Clostridia bacterium]
MTQNEFSAERQRAINQMKEMNAKATNNSIPLPPPLPPPKKQSPPSQGFGLELPFFNLLGDKDTALILGLLLILYGEKADKFLLYALIYILL